MRPIYCASLMLFYFILAAFLPSPALAANDDGRPVSIEKLLSGIDVEPPIEVGVRPGSTFQMQLSRSLTSEETISVKFDKRDARITPRGGPTYIVTVPPLPPGEHNLGIRINDQPRIAGPHHLRSCL